MKRSKPLKVSLISRHIESRGGLEKWTSRLANGFTRRGAEVTILTADPVLKRNFHPLIHPHTLPINVPSASWKMKRFDRLCQKWNRSYRPDIVFAMDRTTEQTHMRAGNGVHAAYLAQRKRFENYRSIESLLNPLNQTILNIEKKGFENPKLKTLFTNSYMVKREALKYYDIPEEKIEVIHNGVEWVEMEKDFEGWIEKKQKLLDELDLDPARFHFLFVGNGYARKGLPFLLHALKHLPSKDFHLSVIGKDRQINHFMEMTQKLSLSRHVSFFGPRQSIRPFYQMADALVIPSIYDPFANVTVEALAMGLFVVSSSFNGGSEILKTENGTVIDALDDPVLFAEALKVAMSHPKTWIRSQAIRDSVKYLDFSSQLSTYLDLTLPS